MLLYKLTDQDGYTRRGESNECLWGPMVTHSAYGTGDRLCSPDVIHAYEDPLLAVLLNPIHADFKTPLLWTARGRIVACEGQLKCGVRTLTTVERIPLPMVTTEQRVRFAIYCAWESCENVEWRRWAQARLAGVRGPADEAFALLDHYAARYAWYAAEFAERETPTRVETAAQWAGMAVQAAMHGDLIQAARKAVATDV